MVESELKVARETRPGLFDLVLSCLLVVALMASPGVTSPHWSFSRQQILSPDRSGPWRTDFAKASEFISHLRHRVVAKTANPWRREHDPLHAGQPTPDPVALSTTIDALPDTIVLAAAVPEPVGLPGGPLPRAYDPQGPPPVIA